MGKLLLAQDQPDRALAEAEVAAFCDADDPAAALVHDEGQAQDLLVEARGGGEVLHVAEGDRGVEGLGHGVLPGADGVARRGRELCLTPE